MCTLKPRTIGRLVRHAGPEQMGLASAAHADAVVLAIAAEKGAGAELLNSLPKITNNGAAMLFKQTGHFVPEERPEALAQIMRQFIAGKSIPKEWTPDEKS